MKVGRKENGQGTVRRLTNGKIQCSIETHDALGKRKIITATAAKETEARKKAQSKLKQYKALLMNNKEDDKGLATKTLKEVMGGKWFDDYARNKWTSRTKKSRENDLKILYDALGMVRLDKISTSIMNDFFANALTPTNRQRLGMVYSITNAFFDDMYNEGILENNVFGRGIKKLPSPRKTTGKEYTLEEIDKADFEDANIKFFRDEEIIKLKDSLTFMDANAKPLYPRAPIYYLMFLTGMRGQEVRALNVNDINFEKHTIRIDKAASTKIENGKETTIIKSVKTSSSERTISINSETEALLRRIIKERKNTDKSCKILYCTKNNSWVGKDNFVRDFRKLLKDLDIEPDGRGPHALRHTFASFAIEKNELSPLKNESPLVISNYLGHANLDITLRIYTHLDKNKLQNIDIDEPEKVIEIEYK